MCGGDMSGQPLLGFWGKAPTAKGFPGYWSLRERWMRESRCYFFLPYAQKVGGTRTPCTPISYAYACTRSSAASKLWMGWG